MNIEYVRNLDGIRLTNDQLDKCRSFATAFILQKYHEEFECERQRLVAERLKLIKAQLSPNNAVRGAAEQRTLDGLVRPSGVSE
jgi:hypothetical protein